MAKGKKYVTNYAQWRSQADIDSMMADPEIRKQLKQAGELADSVNPILCELRGTFKAAA